MTRALLAIVLLGLCSCTTPHIASHFDRPSTQPIQKAHQQATTWVQSAKHKVAVVADKEKDPVLKLQIVAIQADLDNALKSLSDSETARVLLDLQLDQTTKKANALADSYDKAAAKIASVEASRHHWVKYFWYSSGLLALAGLWILRKPILMLVAGGL